MESSSYDPFEDSTDSSSADPTSADPPPAQTLPGSPAKPAPADMEPTTFIDNDDSASDISMSADSDDEEDQEPDSPTGQIIADQQDQKENTNLDMTDQVLEPTKKRKFSESTESLSQEEDEDARGDRKRLKPVGSVCQHRTAPGQLTQDKSLLPAEIWHHVFTFCRPKTLGSLLQVNKSFNAYLDASSFGTSIAPLSKSALQILTPDTIWRAARHSLPGTPMPLPLLSKSELDMWKIACGSFCEFCGKKNESDPTIPTDQWHPGPGEKGVIPVWSFGVRSCGPCLQTQSIKEIDLLLSSTMPSPLMTALPFIFLTNELHALSAATLQNGQHPSSIQITKHYSNAQVREIKEEFESVKTMGAATTEEWLKGLDDRGRERRNDAARWERWEVSGGVAKMRNSGNDGLLQNSTQTNSSVFGTAVLSGSQPSMANGNSSSVQDHPSLQVSTSFPQKSVFQLPQIPQLPTTIHNMTMGASPRFDSPSHNGLPPHPPPPRPFQQAKHERTKEEVAELKAARRAEIERRCMLLTPPITASVLAQMPSFQAAIQIIQPLGDSAWDVLKPRLLSQRVEAEQREHDRLAQTRVAQERFDSLRYQDMQARSDSKDLVDREWDDFQAPLRARIGGYAEEIIRDGWANGEKVSYDTAPLFAAEVLIYVRKRFYAEVAKDEAAIRATGREPEMDPPEGPYTRKLILENMKWVFDTKIKPFTEPHRKELFLCNACEYAAKYYGFEGVIQHFAAKHTSALSFGSIVVHWKSEWPENPPFNPDPNSVEQYYGTEPSASVPYQTTGPPPQQSFGYGGYQTAPVSSSMQGPSPHSYQETPASYYGNGQFGDQYSNHQNGAYGPSPQTYPDTSQGYQGPQYSVAPPQANISGYNDMSQDYSQQGYNGQYHHQVQTAYSQTQPGPSYPSTGPDYSLQQQNYAPPTTQYGPSYTPQASYPPNNYPQAQSQPPQKTEEYTAQLQNVARNAREVWSSIGNLKEIPGSLKVYTIIYHLLNRYRAIFQDDPPLSMIVDGLSNNKDMRPVRNINGLLCKACSLGMAGATSAPAKKHFSFPQLVNHFRTVHEQGVPPDLLGHIPDWTKDMVDLPDMSKLTTVANAPGMNDQKFKLFTEALPELVAPPQQDVAEIDMGPAQQYGPYPDQYGYNGQLAPSQDNHEKYYTATQSGRPSEAGSVTYDSGEYDPRNPHDLPMDHGTSYKLPRQDPTLREPDNYEPTRPTYQYESRQAAPPPIIYQESADMGYVDQRPVSQPSHTRPATDYDRVIVREEPVYMGRPIRYREPSVVEYKTRREAPDVYEGSRPSSSGREYRLTNEQSYSSNRGNTATHPYEAPTRDSRLHQAENATVEHNHISDVVAQISQQAQQARERIPIKPEPVDAGSEDGEVRVEPSSRPEPSRPQVHEDASSAAERFLNDFIPGETAEAASKGRQEAGLREENPPRAEVEVEYKQGSGPSYPRPLEPQRPSQIGYEEDDRYYPSTTGRPIHPREDEIDRDGYIVRERGPTRTIVYEDAYPGTMGEHTTQRGRSPELVDRRFKLNNVIYREERQSSHGTHRTPSRYARYESARLENDRVRSRSPAYVKVGPQPGQYRERSPGAPIVHQEPIYRTRTPPLAADEVAYERQPRPEYYRVYAEEPRREPQYELVRVSDPRGDYMIRRVIREPEPIYASYNDDRYSRQPVYESRPPPSRSGPVSYEEYDPHHPEPAPAPVRQVAYQ